MESYTMPGHIIRRLNQRSTTVFNQVMQQQGFDITSVQFAAMQALQSMPNIEQAHVATLIYYDRATIGSVLDRLEQKGYLQRQVSPSDKRAKICRLSDLGEKVLNEVTSLVRDLQRDIVAGLSDEEVATFIALSMKVLQQNPA